MQAGALYRPALLDGSLALDGGENLRLRFKAFVYNGTMAAFWEFRRFFVALMTGFAEQLPVNRFIKSQRQQWYVFCERLCVDLSQMLKPSMRAAARTEEDVVQDVHVRAEWTVASPALVCILCYWSVHRHIVLQRHRSQAMLEFLATHVRDVPGRARAHEIARQVANSCAEEPCTMGMCPHMSSCLFGDTSDVGSPAKRFASLLTVFSAFVGCCMAYAAVLETLVKDFAAALDQELWDNDELVMNLGRMEHVRFGKRRLRTDEDFKRHVVVDCIAKKVAHNVSQVVRVLGDVSPSLPARWEIENLCKYMASGWRHFGKAHIFVLTEDAARWGQPPEDTMVYTLFSPDLDVAMYPPPQVIIDWNGKRRDREGHLSEGGLQNLRDAIDSFLTEQESHSAPKFDARSLKQKLLPNYRHMRALDHTLVSATGQGLSAFLPARRPTALAKGQRRFEIDIQELPAELQQEAHGRLVRWCVEDIGGSDSWLEVAWDSENRKVFHNILDRGSVGWQSKFFMFGELGIRGEPWPDIHHRRWNSALRSIHGAGLTMIKLDIQLVFNLSRGPWHKGANFGKLSEAAFEYLSSVDCDDRLFGQYYPWLVEDATGFNPPPTYGTQAHMKEVFDSLIEARALNCKGGRSKMNRWFDWVKKAQWLKESWSTIALVLVYIGLHEKWFGNISELEAITTASAALRAPRPGQAASSASSSAASSSVVPFGAPPAPVAVVGPAPSTKDTVGSSERDVQGSAKCKNMMFACCRILSNRSTYRVMVAMQELISPIEQAHNLTVTTTKTQSGCKAWLVGMASGDYELYLGEILNLLTQPSFFRKIGIQEDEGATFELDDLEDSQLIETVVDLATRLIFNELVNCMFYSERPYGRFFAALHDDAEVVTSTMKWAKGVWEALDAAECAAHDDPWLANYVADLVWSKHTLDREMFIACGETKWQKIPSDMHAELLMASRGPVCTKANEDGFSVFSDETRQSKAGVLGRNARWHRLVTSQLLEESDRKQCSTTNADAYAAPKKLPTAMYEAEGSSPTVDDDVLTRILGEKTWPSPSVEVYDLIPFATAALVKCAGEYSRLKRAWLSKMVPLRSLLFNKSLGKEFAMLVIGSTPFGLIGVPVQPCPVGAFKLVVIGKVQRLKWEHIVISSLDGWFVSELEFVPPKIARRRLGPAVVEKLGGFICFVRTGSTASVLTSSAKVGFRGLQFQKLLELMDVIGVTSDGKKPSTEAAVLRVLLHHLFPGISDESLLEIIKLRNPKMKIPWVSVLDKATLEELKPELTDELYETTAAEIALHSKIAEGTCKKVQAARPPTDEKVAHKKSVPKSRSHVGAKVKAPPKQMDVPHDDIDLNYARNFLPQVKGCTLRKEDFHKRWRVYYPRSSPPYSASQVWVAGNMRSSLFFCLRWAWREHFDATAEDCPYVLIE